MASDIKIPDAEMTNKRRFRAQINEMTQMVMNLPIGEFNLLSEGVKKATEILYGTGEAKKQTKETKSISPEDMIE